MQLRKEQAIAEAGLAIQVGGSPTWIKLGGAGYQAIGIYYDFDKGEWRWPTHELEVDC